MSTPQEPETSPELTPEARSILARARRSFVISMGLLVLGLIAIGGALVYRASQSSPPPQGGDYVIAALQVPEGAEIVSAVAADGHLTVTYRVGALTSVRIFDGRTGAMVREIPVLSD